MSEGAYIGGTMDRYDAILEHLKMAQSQSRETMANRFDSLVSSLEQLVNTPNPPSRKPFRRKRRRCFRSLKSKP